MAAAFLQLRVIWTEASPAEDPTMEQRLQAEGVLPKGTKTEFGMQRGLSEVVAGEQQPDGTTLFKVTVERYVDRAGRQRFRGEYVQGPPAEPFFYLSWRVAGEASWIMRAKVLLTSLTPEALDAIPDGAALQTSVSRMGHRPAGFVQEWTQV